MRKSGQQKQKFSHSNKDNAEYLRRCSKDRKRITKLFRKRLRASLSEIRCLKTFIQAVIRHAEALYDTKIESPNTNQIKQLQLAYIRHVLTDYDAILFEVRCPGQKELMRTALHAIVKECHTELISRLCQESQGQ